ncbi:hypothetical protein Hanom_Chr10g00892141 [Helianthus anomalus]
MTSIPNITIWLWGGFSNMVIKPTNVSTRNIVTYTKIKLLSPNDWHVIFYLPCDKKEITNLTRKYPT